MMEANETTEIPEAYVKGFNDGYLLAKESPDLLNTLLQGNQSKSSEYFKGLVSGKRELEKELSLAKLNNKLQHTKETKSINKDKDLSKE